MQKKCCKIQRLGSLKWNPERMGSRGQTPSQGVEHPEALRFLPYLRTKISIFRPHYFFSGFIIILFFLPSVIFFLGTVLPFSFGFLSPDFDYGKTAEPQFEPHTGIKVAQVLGSSFAYVLLPQNSKDAVNLVLVNHHNDHFAISYYRRFSCDVISSQFCKSSYWPPPCWFPLSMERYRKKQQNVPFLFSSYYNTKL